MELNYHDQSKRVWFVKKTSQDNIVIDCIGLVYTETKIELSGPIWSGAVCDKNQTGQWRDCLYKYDLHKKLYWTIVIN